VLLTVTWWTELPVTALMSSGLAQRRELITFLNLFSWQPCCADPRRSCSNGFVRYRSVPATQWGEMEKKSDLFLSFTVVKVNGGNADCAGIVVKKDKRMSPSLWSKKRKECFYCLSDGLTSC
jgi:hypothetical protein